MVSKKRKSYLDHVIGHATLIVLILFIISSCTNSRGEAPLSVPNEDVWMKEKGKLFEETARVSPLKADSFATESILLSEELGFDKAKGKFLYSKARNLSELQQLTQADSIAELCIAHYRMIGDSVGVADCISITGNIKRRLDQFRDAREDYLHAKEIYVEYNDSLGVNIILNNLGILAEMTGDYDEAVEFYLEALEDAKEQNDTVRLAYANQNIGIVAYYQKDYDEAVELQRKTNDLFRKSGFPRKLIEGLQNEAIFLDNAGRFDESEESLKEALRIVDSLSLKKQRSVVLTVLAGHYIDIGKLEKAKKIFLSELERPSREISPGEKAILIMQLSEISFKQGKYDEALIDLNKGISLLDSTERLPLLYDFKVEKGNVLAETGNYREAYTLIKEGFEAKEKLVNIERNETIEKLKIQYKDKEQRDAITILELENETKTKQLVIAIGGVVSFLLLASLGFYLFTRQKRLRQVEYDRAELISDRFESMKEHNRELADTIKTLETAPKSEAEKLEILLDQILTLENKTKDKIQLRDIVFLESDREKTIVHTISGRKHTVWVNLKNHLAQLPSTIFCRIHRSYVVNLAYVTGTLSKEVKLDVLGNVLPIGSTKLDDFREELARFEDQYQKIIE
jgi:tetratricopeptide (TPR) repeat protein